jgi:hypothetical protein
MPSKAYPSVRAGLAQAHAVTGDKLAMERIVKELGESSDRYVSPYNIARVYGAIDDRQRALEWLERAYREHNPDLIELTREPSFAGLHSDAKFRELVERIGWRSVAAALLWNQETYLAAPLIRCMFVAIVEGSPCVGLSPRHRRLQSEVLYERIEILVAVEQC